MARGIAIKDVTNKLQPQDVANSVVIPVSSGQDEPEVIEVGTLKGYINDDTEIPLDELARILT